VLASFAPDLVVIDTLMAACDLEDTNSNAEAVRMMKGLRALAREYGCAVLLLHHERKRSTDHPSSSGQAMMGARQWAGQADLHMTLTVESDFVTEPVEPEGHERTKRTFKWRPAEKDRDGRVNAPRRVAVESERDAAGRYVWMRVTDEGPLAEDDAKAVAEAAILRALSGAEGDGLIARKAIATATGEPNPSEPGGTFKRALGDLVEAGKAEQPTRGKYKITDHGREAVTLDF
jgi:hypothetical protein